METSPGTGSIPCAESFSRTRSRKSFGRARAAVASGLAHVADPKGNRPRHPSARGWRELTVAGGETEWRQYCRGELPRHFDFKPDMNTKKWLELREAIVAEPDLETYRCKKVQLYLYLLGRSPQYRSICNKGEARLELRLRWGQQ